jgi:hypothetical protein
VPEKYTSGFSRNKEREEKSAKFFAHMPLCNRKGGVSCETPPVSGGVR